MRQWLLLQGHPEQDMNQIYRFIESMDSINVQKGQEDECKYNAKQRTKSRA
jgi:hypothetical protein